LARVSAVAIENCLQIGETMAARVPVTVFADPDVESTFTIKPFAAGLATKPQSLPNAAAQRMTQSAGITGDVNSRDADLDIDYSD